MFCKIVLPTGEIHRLPEFPKTLPDLRTVVKAKFTAKVPDYFDFKYEDAEKGPLIVSTDSEFNQLVKIGEQKKTLKLFVVEAKPKSEADSGSISISELQRQYDGLGNFEQPKPTVILSNVQSVDSNIVSESGAPNKVEKDFGGIPITESVVGGNPLPEKVEKKEVEEEKKVEAAVEQKEEPECEKKVPLADEYSMIKKEPLESKLKQPQLTEEQAKLVEELVNKRVDEAQKSIIEAMHSKIQEIEKSMQANFAVMLENRLKEAKSEWMKEQQQEQHKQEKDQKPQPQPEVVRVQDKKDEPVEESKKVDGDSGEKANPSAEEARKIPKDYYKAKLVREPQNMLQNLAPRENYKISFTLRNAGEREWPKTTCFRCINGFYAKNSKNIGLISPEFDCDIELELQAPEEPGHYSSSWRLSFGDDPERYRSFWPEIHFRDSGSSTKG